ncbi:MULTISPECIES: GntR family transcriptional regulator [Amycolatopsis]|uniref:GntR family transcriptional regulator n=1 Tax=Amycolatopsis TaxID=1813 RepID=UPI000B8AF0E3|nr:MULTISPECIES: GntR family transcriptional regulator [Amycolatopsis]OXM70765.1 transcriptional regulator [Amycolatopsis sp. KNN50.9b]
MVDPSNGVAVYRQIAHALREKIGGGEYEPGSKLPSETQLVEQYDVSRRTVREAMRLLAADGLVTIKHGVGVFVRPPASVTRLARSRLSRAARARNEGAFLADAARQGFTPSTSVRIRFEPADARAAELLGIAEGDEVTVRDRVMRANGLIVQLAVSRLPREFTRGTVLEEVDTGKGGAYARLEEAGHVISQFMEDVGARMPTDEERTQLELPPGTPVLTVTRLAFRTDGVALEMNDIIMAADRYRLVYEWEAE